MEEKLLEDGKVFALGVIDYDTFYNFYETQSRLVRKIKFLCDAGCETDNPGEAVDFIGDLICDAEKDLEEFFERAWDSKEKAGGIYVKTVILEEFNDERESCRVGIEKRRKEIAQGQEKEKAPETETMREGG